jgi:alpha-beta hydrolase superfamily lysophospholipase
MNTPPAGHRWLLLLVGMLGCMPPSWGASAMLHPGRRPPKDEPTRPFEPLKLDGAGVRLEGWLFRAQGPVQRGTVVYLHGMGDSRRSSVGIAAHLVPRGFDVLAYDSRAHGQSEGSSCTYGVYEKQDLLRVLPTIAHRPIILFGVSLGAAVALQAAALSKDVAAVVSLSTFSDLRTVAHERAPFFASEGNISRAFQLAEAEAKFHVDEASPVAAAPQISAPVLLLHGAADDETPPAHSQRVYDALKSPRRLIMVPGAGHNDVLGPRVWPQIDGWLSATLGGGSISAAPVAH